MQKIFIDYVGKLPRSKAGNLAILICVHAFSKFAWMIPVQQATTKATIKALQERIFSSFSVPEILVSDNAQCFTSKEFQRFCFELGVKHVTTSPYYPQPSHAEQFNMNLRSNLIAYHRGTHAMCDQNLTCLQLAFNTAEHESTKAAPFLVIFPFRTGSPLINQWKINKLLPERFNRKVLKHKWLAVKQNLLKSQASMALRYNHNHVLKPFKVGDLVYYRNHPISHTGCQITAKLLHC
jgi:transposase InsO family protein